MAIALRFTVVGEQETPSVLLRSKLAAEGHEVDTARRGDEAGIRLQEQVPNPLILDWMLPGLSGIAPCGRLRNRRRPSRFRPCS